MPDAVIGALAVEDSREIVTLDRDFACWRDRVNGVSIDHDAVFTTRRSSGCV